MEHDEDAIECMARTMYDLWRQDRDLNDTHVRHTWPAWEGLHHALKQKWLVIAARAHTAYHDQYEALARR